MSPRRPSSNHADRVFVMLCCCSSNVIGGVEADTFTNMPNLHQLAMQNNRLGKLPSTVFMAAVRMSHLYVCAGRGEDLGVTRRAGGRRR